MTSIIKLSSPGSGSIGRPAAPSVTPAGQFAAALAGQSVNNVAAPPLLAALQPALLDLQADAYSRDEPARRRARSLLAGLSSLQLDLLRGDETSEESLRELGRQAADLPQAAHPKLAAVLRGLAVRVEVELARRLPG